MKNWLAFGITMVLIFTGCQNTGSKNNDTTKRDNQKEVEKKTSNLKQSNNRKSKKKRKTEAGKSVAKFLQESYRRALQYTSDYMEENLQSPPSLEVPNSQKWSKIVDRLFPNANDPALLKAILHATVSQDNRTIYLSPQVRGLKRMKQNTNRKKQAESILTCILTHELTHYVHEKRHNLISRMRKEKNENKRKVLKGIAEGQALAVESYAAQKEDLQNYVTRKYQQSQHRIYRVGHNYLLHKYHPDKVQNLKKVLDDGIPDLMDFISKEQQPPSSEKEEN